LIKNVEDLSNEISTKMIETSDINKDSHKDSKAITVLANGLWDEYVHKPWRILEFGNEKIADDYQDKVLQYSPDNELRADLVKKIEDRTELNTKRIAIKRLGFMFMYFIPMLVNLALMLALCIAIIGFQFLTVFIFLLGIFVFMVALHPAYGMTVVKKWGLKIFGVASMKIVFSFILMVMLVFNQAIFEYAKDEGWVMALFLQLIIYLIVYIKRVDIFSMFRQAKDVAISPNKYIQRLIRTGELNPYGAGTNKSVPNVVRNPGENVKRMIIEKREQMAAMDRNKKEIEKRHRQEFEEDRAKTHLNRKFNIINDREIKKAGKPSYKRKTENGFIKRAVEREKEGKERFSETDINSVMERYRKVEEYKKVRRDRSKPKWVQNFKPGFVKDRYKKEEKKEDDDE
jgi:hypothetical protein